jgi:hypothetical protein
MVKNGPSVAHHEWHSANRRGVLLDLAHDRGWASAGIYRRVGKRRLSVGVVKARNRTAVTWAIRNGSHNEGNDGMAV